RTSVASNPQANSETDARACRLFQSPALHASVAPSRWNGVKWGAAGNGPGQAPSFGDLGARFLAGRCGRAADSVGRAAGPGAPADCAAGAGAARPAGRPGHLASLNGRTSRC